MQFRFSCCPLEKPHPDGGVKSRGTKDSACCPIRAVPNDSMGRFFRTNRGISGGYGDKCRQLSDSSRRYADLPMMQTSQYRNGDEFAWAREFWRRCMRNRRVAVQALMWSCDVIILLDELSQQPFKMTLVEHDHMVEHLAPRGSDESLHDGSLPRTSIGSPNFLYATAVQKRSYAVTIDAVIIGPVGSRRSPRSDLHRW